MIEDLLVHDVTILVPGTKPGRGADTLPDWTDPTEHVEKAWITQESTSDIRPGQTGDTGIWRGMHPATSQIRPGARIEWSGLTFEVDGRPLPAWTPEGHHHTETRLTLVEG